MPNVRRAEELLAGRSNDDFDARLRAIVDEAEARAIILDDLGDVEGARAHRSAAEGAYDLIDLLWSRSQKVGEAEAA